MIQAPAARDILFVSHANPEDNDYSLWLTLRLASEGYAVWCDLTELLGGEYFWQDAEVALREKTIKYLYVLSKNSNHKQGVLDELALAKAIGKGLKLKDFIIPLHIDGSSYSDTNIEAFRINAIDFASSWANGLARLLRKLEKDAVPRNAHFGPSAVMSWWREHFSAETGLLNEPETLFSNWFSISRIPSKVFVHVFQPGFAATALQSAQYPIYEYSNGVVTFAETHDFGNSSKAFWNSSSYRVVDLLNDKHKGTFLDSRTSRDVITNLLRQAWENALIAKGLSTYELASGDQCGYPLKDQIPRDTLTFNLDGFKGRRQIIGYKTVNKRKGTIRYWHFGISGRVFLRSTNYLAVNPHVVFSNDGKVVWNNPDRMHKAKMSQCKDWWNDEWRDRVFALMNFLADEETIKLKLSASESAEVSIRPESFVSPILFHDPTEQNLPEDDGVEDGDELNEDDSDEWN